MLVVVQVLKQKKDDARRLQHSLLNPGSRQCPLPRHLPFLISARQSYRTQSSSPPYKKMYLKSAEMVVSQFNNEWYQIRSLPEVGPDHEDGGGGGGTPGGGHVGPGPAWSLRHSWKVEDRLVGGGQGRLGQGTHRVKISWRYCPSHLTGQKTDPKESR